jgi:gamma-glutamyltranspeptidase/glutathione hydrolase
MVAANPQDMYTGGLAAKIVEGARNAVGKYTKKHGLLSLEDMAGYRAVYRETVAFQHEGESGQEYIIEGASPPFTGGIAHAQIFHMMQHLAQFAEGDEARNFGFFVDAQNAAFADRNRYVADPDFADVPTKELTSPLYLDGRLKQLWGDKPDKALDVPVAAGSPSSAHATDAASFSEDRGTAHTTIIDAAGNLVALTTTVNGIMGSKVIVPGTGLMLNNELCDFDPTGYDSQGDLKVNAPEGGKRPRRTALGRDNGSLGGKRPRSSMSPTVITPRAVPFTDGKVPFTLLGLGAPGGSDIIGGVGNVMRRVFRDDFDPQRLQQVIDAPRAIAKNRAKRRSGTGEINLMSDQTFADKLAGWGYNMTTHKSQPPYYVGETFARVNSALLLGSLNDRPEFVGGADSLRLPACRSLAP